MSLARANREIPETPESKNRKPDPGFGHFPYTPDVQTGRPTTRERTPFGQRLHTLREQAGLSQQQLAERLGLTQRAYAHWERNPVALRPEQLLSLAEALNVSVDDLVG
jgi:DNA-binding XRE family transcriptional regulator